jgi:hypothetical protein
MTNQMLLHTIKRVLKVTVICFLLLLIGFEMVPVNSIRDTQQYIVNAGFQRARSQMLERYAYALQYGPAAEKAQAMSMLKNRSALFQDEQALLATNPDPDVQRLVQQARADYLALVDAVHTLIAHPNETVNQDELATVLFHDQRFFLPMDALTTVLQQHSERQTEQFLLVKGIIEGACVLIAFCWLCIDRSPGRRKSVNNVASNVDATGII